ncbi:MAG: hypothetical protein RL134_2867 [Actinomycetota bacterium]
MPDGELRRPPQLWEQRLARTTAILGAGISSSGDATAIVPPSPPPGAGGGTEPAPVPPAPGLFIAPSTPTLVGAVQGINVVWNGLNSAGDLWPSDTSYVEVHMSTAGTGFTPDASTLKGRLVRPGGLAVVGLTSGVTYHFRLRGADPAGNYTSAGTAASGTPGLVNAPDIAAGAITANSIVAGTITGWNINSAYLSGGTVSGGYITGGTVDGSRIRTASSGSRVELGTTGRVGSVDIFDASDNRADMSYSGGQLSIAGATTLAVNSVATVAGVSVGGGITGATLNISGAAVDMQGVYNNNTTGIDTVGISTGFRLRRISSSQAIKYDITPLSGSLSDSVDLARVCDIATVDPAAILDVAVAEFSVIDEGQPTDRRVLGFIADDVADKLPIAVTRYADGSAAGVLDTSLLAALLAVVQDQAATIEDLRARIEALEA